MHNRMYISISEEDRIAIFDVDATTGRTTHQGDVPTSGRPAPLAVDPERKYMYIGCRTNNELMTFRIDLGDGSLSPIGKISLNSDPCFLATDRTGKFLLSAYYGAGAARFIALGPMVLSLTRRSNGSLPLPEPTPSTPTGPIDSPLCLTSRVAQGKMQSTSSISTKIPDLSHPIRRPA